jgi:hypothetical protein
MIVAILRDDDMRFKASNTRPPRLRALQADDGGQVEQQSNETQNQEVVTSKFDILRFSLGLRSASGDLVTLNFAPEGGTVNSQLFSRSCSASPVSFQCSDYQIALHIIQHRHVLSFRDTGSSRG